MAIQKNAKMMLKIMFFNFLDVLNFINFVVEI